MLVRERVRSEESVDWITVPFPEESERLVKLHLVSVTCVAFVIIKIERERDVPTFDDTLMDVSVSVPLSAENSALFVSSFTLNEIELNDADVL